MEEVDGGIKVEITDDEMEKAREKLSSGKAVGQDLVIDHWFKNE